MSPFHCGLVHTSRCIAIFNLISHMRGKVGAGCTLQLFTGEGSHLLHSGQGSAASSGVWETWGWPGSGRPRTPGHRWTSWPFRCRVNGTQRCSSCSLKVQMSVHKIHWGESCITQLFFFFFLISFTGFKEVRWESSSRISNLDLYDNMMIWWYDDMWSQAKKTVMYQLFYTAGKGGRRDREGKTGYIHLV